MWVKKISVFSGSVPEGSFRIKSANKKKWKKCLMFEIQLELNWIADFDGIPLAWRTSSL